ncbi:hypothetical protein NM688_g7416 [Phlebia brevispora]|uniref:Uncharacterized protein n=1 Tax=Phlebia brevispora TaxID=194682 RepID=A0ACC1S5K4_9APHY|nr:hypothetical protein NM688_g7416 [Phlebia brevispora]
MFPLGHSPPSSSFSDNPFLYSIRLIGRAQGRSTSLSLPQVSAQPPTCIAFAAQTLVAPSPTRALSVLRGPSASLPTKPGKTTENKKKRFLSTSMWPPPGDYRAKVDIAIVLLSNCFEPPSLRPHTTSEPTSELNTSRGHLSTVTLDDLLFLAVCILRCHALCPVFG